MERWFPTGLMLHWKGCTPVNNVLFIESNTTGTGMIALRKAREWGWNPFFFTHDPGRYPGLEDTGCPVIICDTNHIPALKKALEQTVPQKDVAGVTTTSEFYLETVAALSEQYGWRGNTAQVMRTARNKWETRKVLAERDLLQPRCLSVKDPAEAVTAMGKVGFPCVVKPADDSGSNDVRLCHSEEEAVIQANRILSRRTNIRGQKTAGMALVEEYIRGPEYSVEMLSWRGQHFSIGITEKRVTGSPYFVEYGHLFPAPLEEEQAKQMEATVREALNAIGIRFGATHTEVKWTSKGCAIVEVNARLAGGMIPELIRLTMGVDLLEQQIRCAVEKPVIPPRHFQGVAGIRFLLAGKEGELKQVEGLDRARQVTGVKQLSWTAKKGTWVQPPQNAYQRLGYVIVHTSGAEETEARLEEVAGHIRPVMEGVR